MRLGRFGAKLEVTQAIVDLCRELHALPEAVRREAILSLSSSTRRVIEAMSYEWYLWGRPEQLAPPDPWRWWVMSGGRGGGKTRSATEQLLEWADTNPGTRLCLLGKDAGSVRRIMINGPSGILRRSPPWFKPRWFKTDKLIAWPNDTIAEHHSSEEPGTLRGPEYHNAWVTELFHYNIPKGEREPVSWREGIKLTLRLGPNPQGLIDSSPRRTDFCANFLLGPRDGRGNRPVTQEQINSGEWSIRHAIEDHEGKQHTYIVIIRRWSSERNAENLSPGVVAEWRHDLRGSPLEEQELDGKILVKVEGALWSLEVLDTHSVYSVPVPIVKTLVAVDPTRADAPTDEAGIMVGSLGADGHAYIFDDCTVRGRPAVWARRAVEAKNQYRAEAVVIEKNRLEYSTRQTFLSIDPGVKWIEVQATDGKRTRAEPVSAAYEQGRVHHVRDRRDQVPRFARLEEEMVSWDPRARQASPNRMDALVWLVWALLGLDEHVKKPIRLL